MLFTPGGVQWHGDGHDKAYRAGAKGRRVNAPWLESEVVTRVANDFRDPKFLARTIAEARRMADGIEADPVALDGEMKSREAAGNLLELARHGREGVARKDSRDPKHHRLTAPAEKRLDRTCNAKTAPPRDRREGHYVCALHERPGYFRAAKTFRRRFQRVRLGEHMRLSRDEMRKVLTTLVERIELEPTSRELSIRYRIPVTGVKSVPTGIRTPVTAVKGRCPRPLDDGEHVWWR